MALGDVPRGLVAAMACMLLAGKNRQASNDLGDFIKDATKMMRKGELAAQFGQPIINGPSSAMSQL